VSDSGGTIRFPCDALPSEGAQARLLGLYPQRQSGLFMQRVRIPGGVISAAQWRAVAEASARHAPGYPLHLTTRQDIEIHGVPPERIPALQRDLYAAGLSTVRACGDTLRNVTLCPGNALCEGTVDVAPAAEAITRAAEGMAMIRALPRKFKVSLSACPKACALPWINDLGLIARTEGGFAAVVAGSLGPRPATGLALERVFAAAEVAPLARAALRLFNAEGDRVNRGRARLRHVRERLGDAEFVARLTALFDEERVARGDPAPPLRRVTGASPRQVRLRPRLGNIAILDALELGRAVEKAGASLRVGFEHDLFLFGGNGLTLPPALAAREGAPAIVACPGSAWCGRAIVDTHEPVAAMDRALGSDFGGLVAVSGCPNGCAQSSVGAIGLAGCVRTIAGARRPCFRLLVGGGGGRDARLAREIHPGIDAAVIPGVVRMLAERYRSRVGQEDLSFADWALTRTEELPAEIGRVEGWAL